MSTALERLETLAERDEVLAPLARLYALALRTLAAPEGQWLATCLATPAERSSATVPFLHEQTIAVDLAALAHLLRAAGEILDRSGLLDGGTLERAVANGRLPLRELVRAGILADPHASARLAVAAGLPERPVTVLGQLLVIPVLAAVSHQADAAFLRGWRAGFCPVCAAWPTLAEFRGLERERWLRCGRCGTGWRYPHQQCPFCENADHRSLRYFAEEGKHESQRVEVCDRCRGYVKTFATLGPWSHGDVLLQDLTTVELDLAAAEREYRRPDGLGFPLSLSIVARELTA
ncbi:MAG: formate dehydrogenase accessory protein FdhE [Thermomicrobium sp.]|nr:formate dehydrogenase accessory protein FdhE [Thermomicrobium sp.]